MCIYLNTLALRQQAMELDPIRITRLIQKVSFLEVRFSRSL